MNSADLFYHERLPPNSSLDLERWGGILALAVFSGSVSIEKIEGLRADESVEGRRVAANSAIVIFGPGRISVATGPEGADILAQGTSDESILDSIPPNTPSACDIALDFTGINRLKRILPHGKNGGAIREISLRHERFAALAWLCSIAVEGAEGQEGNRKDTRYVERAIGHFRENIESQVRLPDLAWSLGITEEYLAKLFREEVGIPPMKYFRIMKIGEAERLLAEGTWSVKEVSWMLGFASQHHFSKAFKAIRGYNPSECRTETKKAAKSTAEWGPDAPALDDLGKEIDAPTDR